MFGLVKRYFDGGIYSKENVATFVRAGKLTAAEFEDITGVAYIG